MRPARPSSGFGRKNLQLGTYAHGKRRSGCEPYRHAPRDLVPSGFADWISDLASGPPPRIARDVHRPPYSAGLRIVGEDLWQSVKARQQASRSDVISQGVMRPERARRARHLLSGLLKCGVCGGGYSIVGKAHFGCASARNKGTCSNRLTIRRDRLEDRVLNGLKDELLHPDLIAEFTRAYQAEYNRLAGTIQQDRAKAERELAQVTGKISNIIEAISDGMFHPSMKDKMTALEARKEELEAELQEAPTEPPVLLHPSLAGLYREQVAGLTAALNDPATKSEAGTILRSLLSEVRLIPENGSLAIELVGELAGLMALGQTKAALKAGASGRSVSLVAGAGF
ncbi:zinc ribbon domain-containing protein, partial [Leisingera sp. ANG-S5]|uniref:zinc ribbon domain-containing protein n=1 Tax=Leisingera sp. ANG-S5 TaxID=1577901 RepID=UPI00187C64D9